MDLAALDWFVIGVYLAGMIALSWGFSRGQRSQRDYYLGGNRTGALPIALSTMATQSSTNSMLGIPAFVGFSTVGGLVWLQGEIALPFAMIVLMVFLFPIFRRLNLISVYAYLEKRFGPGTRTVAVALFLLTRAFATGVTVFGVSLILAACLGVPFWGAVLLLCLVTIVYDTLGGMKAVIWSDVIQLVVIFGSVVLAIGLAVDLVGGLGAVFETVDARRLKALDFGGHGLGDGNTFAFWPTVFGTLFLYVSYYGCDQTQAQRELATRSVEDTNRALFWGGLFRFPLVLAYGFLGLAIAAFAAMEPEFLAGLPVKTSGEEPEPDYNLAVPFFVAQHFPVGLVGLVVVGMLAAAMSSIDSTLNSLSASSMQDVVLRFSKRELSARAELVLSKLTTVFWGAATLVFAFFVGDISETVVESINKIGSLVYGPMLAVFMLGVLSRRVNGQGAVIGLGAGFVLNLCLWIWAPLVSWQWWNVIGFLATAAVGILSSRAFAAPEAERLEETVFRPGEAAVMENLKRWRWAYVVLFAYGLGIIGVLALFGG